MCSSDLAASNPGARCGIIAPTSGDIRDTCLEGVSGVLAVLPEPLIASYNRSISEVVLKNGSVIKGFSAQEPDRLRGPQHDAAWCDELAKWRYAEASFDMLQFVVRQCHQCRCSHLVVVSGILCCTACKRFCFQQQLLLVIVTFVFSKLFNKR